MSRFLAQGSIRKMRVSHQSPIQYDLPIGEQLLPLSPLISQQLKLSFNGNIYCIHCRRKTKKSFSQGYCYPCFRDLAECDRCIVSPELCHFDQGTCRDEEWGLNHCIQPHYVYLANSSGLKVGITRGTQLPTRWIDQGASQAVALFKVKNRLTSGKLEVLLKAHISDRTDWRKMLKGEPEQVDFEQITQELLNKVTPELQSTLNQADYELLSGQKVKQFNYPVQQYPEKVSALNFDKQPEIDGLLKGIKGQYLIFDTGVLNIRKFAGYEISVSA